MAHVRIQPLLLPPVACTADPGHCFREGRCLQRTSDTGHDPVRTVQPKFDSTVDAFLGWFIA